jgi:hypothetical protein
MLARRGNSRPPFRVRNHPKGSSRRGQAGKRPACFRCLDRPAADDPRSTPAPQQTLEHTHHVDFLLYPLDFRSL